MSKRVVVVASGETERRALPSLVGHLRANGIVMDDVRVPPRHARLDVQMAERLVKAAWFEDPTSKPDKFVVLVDVDTADPEDVLRPFETQLPQRLANVHATILYAIAQRHLEAWFFGDAAGLRGWLGGSLGNVDTSNPDAIPNPKLHLRHLLGQRLYTSRVSEDIASSLDPASIAMRSPSFRRFQLAVTNGNPGA